jgi:Txe/YoeB family toxin of Txe-Axe toxin-antitoxin module
LTGTIYFCESQQYQLSELLADKIKEHTPYFRGPDLQKWAKQMDAIQEIDQRPPKEIKEVILFSQSDPFWKKKIHSVSTLRKQYDQLNSRRLQAGTSPTPHKYQKADPKVKKVSKFESFYVE